MNVTASMALRLIPETLRTQPVFLCIDNTIVPKYGKKFEDVSKPFGHSVHNGSGYLNGHCFVSVMLCVPVWNKDRIVYQALPLSYRMRQKEKSKLKLAASMARQAMPELKGKTNVITLCDSWYTKGGLASVVDEYPNLGLIGNARYDPVLYDLAPQPAGKRGRSAKHGKRLSAERDFTLSDEKIGGYYIGARRVLTNIFGTREVLAYVTATKKEGGSRRLFLSTVFPTQLQIFCAWQEKAPLNQTGSAWMDYIPLFLYSFRWNIMPISA